MTPKGYTERYTRHQLFAILAALGSVLVLACALEGGVEPGSKRNLVSLVAPSVISIGVVLFGYRALIPAAIIAYVVRQTGFSSGDFAAIVFTVRDVMSAMAVNLIVSRFRFFKRDNQTFDFGGDGFHSVLKAIPDVLLIIDAQGRCCQVFTGDERLLVKPPEEIIGRHLRELMPKSEAERGRHAIDRVLATGIHGYLEHEIKINDERKSFSATIVPFEYRGKKAVLWASREITKLKSTQRRQQETEDILRNLLRLQERERKLVSCELHDGILQHIIVAHMLSQVLHGDVADRIPDAGENLLAIQRTLSDAIREGRGLIEELRPIMIDEESVIDAIDYMVKEEGHRNKASITFNFEGSFDDIPPLLEGNIFRIVQESLANVRRHSHADKVTISIVHDDDNVRLRIVDNGVGFDPEQVPEENFGLKSISRRAQLFAGSAIVESAPGKGTTVAVSLPISASNSLPAAS